MIGFFCALLVSAVLLGCNRPAESDRGGENSKSEVDYSVPRPEPLPIEPTFESIDRYVFQRSCVDCHNPSGSGKRVPLDKESLLDSPLELVIPFNSEESGLIISLIREDSKGMPPLSDGYAPLTSEQINVIRRWIDRGAKD
ncbi:c-type cytochrome [Bdellovibrio bacteriovorus]|uniref:c-type cytochrome n=1 Tax=Bdellovibrio bacteriovorus TaxID=959 RepID=UPI0035A69735